MSFELRLLSTSRSVSFFIVGSLSESDRVLEMSSGSAGGVSGTMATGVMGGSYERG